MVEVYCGAVCGSCCDIIYVPLKSCALSRQTLKQLMH